MDNERRKRIMGGTRPTIMLCLGDVNGCCISGRQYRAHELFGDDSRILKDAVVPVNQFGPIGIKEEA